MTHADRPVIIVGGGIAGLACARSLNARGIFVQVLEASSRIGGRIKTDQADGFLLDRGFQVLQTAYPEARRTLDYLRLDLNHFAPGAMIRIRDRFYTLADPLRRPGSLIETLTAPIGGLGDRLRLLRLSRQVTRGPLDSLFEGPEATAMDFLRQQGFSEKMIQRFFVPFFGGVCLDSRIRASSHVLRYVLRMFATGEAALPATGMQAIPKQLAEELPLGALRTGVGVRQIDGRDLTLEDGSSVKARAVVVATEAPEAATLLNLPSTHASIAETCIYFSCDRAAWHSSFLLLNGDGSGPINNIAIPSQVSPAYAPVGKSLVSVVVLGNPHEDDSVVIDRVKEQLVDWFGPESVRWTPIAAYRIKHALPDQSPPTPDPTRTRPHIRPGLFVCGEYGSLPGIQWALVSGRQAADAVSKFLAASGG
jgi:phytoene dehydrogenase-like protein